MLSTNGINSACVGSESNEGSGDNTGRRGATRRDKSIEWSTEEEINSDNSETPRVTTRRAWSDYCKGRSSQSDEDNNNNKGKNKRGRKKLRRKLPRAGKTSAVFSAPPARTMAPTKRAKAKAKKGKAKKAIKISGLDLLHNETLLSTSPQANNGKKPPAAPGCVDQQLTSLTAAGVSRPIHEEFEIPKAPASTPYSLQILFDLYKDQMLSMINTMKQPEYKECIQSQILVEKERKQKLSCRAAQLEKQIKVLIDDSVAFLKMRMNELGINASTPGDLLSKAKEIVLRHKDLQSQATKLQSTVTSLEEENARLLTERQTEMAAAARQIGITSPLTQEQLLQEIFATMTHRKKLHTHVNKLETELTALQQKSSQPSTSTSGVSKPTTEKASSGIKQSRKSRDHRCRSQDWPDVPDVGKIEENNPEILAQKILETGRQIEAGKIRDISKPKEPVAASSRSQQPARSSSSKSLLPSTSTGGGFTSNRAQEPPRVANFEDRLKSIITTVLNEDQHARTQAVVKERERKSSSNPTFIPPVLLATHQQQPDYTQVSPAKLALRRHLSQEKLAASQHPATPSSSTNIVGTRTIGDLVNGEIERTLEISNQSIINAAVDMSTTPTHSSVLNMHVPSRPERVSPPVPQNYNHTRHPLVHHANPTTACRYTPVQLPRAELKPYHESYFSDVKPYSREEPVEGLAATLHARILNGDEVKQEEQAIVPRYESPILEIKTEPGHNLKRRSPQIYSPIKRHHVDDLPPCSTLLSPHRPEEGIDKWQDKISSGFDRLVAFASTELDKRRRSTEGGVSCNTSPDSGIGHGESSLHKEGKKVGGPPQLYRPAMSPERDSPPVLELPHGPPRTPSPSSSPLTPLLPLDGPYYPVPAHSPPTRPNRYTKSSGHHHFKKKYLRHKGKFSPKGKEWNWHQTAEGQQPWC